MTLTPNMSKGGACTCYDVRHFTDPRCPLHGNHSVRAGTCRVCGGLNGQHFAMCPEDRR